MDDGDEDEDVEKKKGKGRKRVRGILKNKSGDGTAGKKRKLNDGKKFRF